MITLQTTVCYLYLWISWMCQMLLFMYFNRLVTLPPRYPSWA
jgi:hypothetical protein